MKTLQNIAANHTRVKQAHHRRSTSNAHSLAIPVSPYATTSYGDPHDDSGIALSVGGGDGSRRSSGSGGGVMPGWNQILQ